MAVWVSGRVAGKRDGRVGRVVGVLAWADPWGGGGACEAKGGGSSGVLQGGRGDPLSSHSCVAAARSASRALRLLLQPHQTNPVRVLVP